MTVGLADAAYQCGMSIYFATLDDLVVDHARPKATGRFNRQLQAFLRPALLVVDEVGYLPLDRAEANMFFQLINRRLERGPMIVTSKNLHRGSVGTATRIGHTYPCGRAMRRQARPRHPPNRAGAPAPGWLT